MNWQQPFVRTLCLTKGTGIAVLAMERHPINNNTSDQISPEDQKASVRDMKSTWGPGIQTVTVQNPSDSSVHVPVLHPISSSPHPTPPHLLPTPSAQASSLSCYHVAGPLFNSLKEPDNWDSYGIPSLKTVMETCLIAWEWCLWGFKQGHPTMRAATEVWSGSSCQRLLDAQRGNFP